MRKTQVANFPPEYIPAEYDQRIFQRLMEDVYKNFERSQRETLDYVNSIYNELSEDVADASLESGVGSMEKYAPLPTPTGLRVFKIFNLVVAWCNPIQIFKYPGVKGYQFFGSIGTNDFPVLVESAKVTITGTHTAAAGDAAWLVRATATKSTILGRKSLYRTMPFWSDMQLNSKSAGLTNTTQSLTATLSTSCWDKSNPTILCASLTGGAPWADGDAFEIYTWFPKTMIGMGVFPMCVHILPADYAVDNPKYDGISYFVKARTYGDSKYSDFASASSTGYEAAAPTGLTVSDIRQGTHPTEGDYYHYYRFGRPYVDIQIEWDTVADADSYVVKVVEQ